MAKIWDIFLNKVLKFNDFLANLGKNSSLRGDKVAEAIHYAQSAIFLDKIHAIFTDGVKNAKNPSLRALRTQRVAIHTLPAVSLCHF